ncbi:MAG: hypothetical protein FJ397_07990 [Verrucomicrobia bacterium]|nr:hypothetical protein [Verrucomicrobiota bacterium]
MIRSAALRWRRDLTGFGLYLLASLGTPASALTPDQVLPLPADVLEKVAPDLRPMVERHVRVEPVSHEAYRRLSVPELRGKALADLASVHDPAVLRFVLERFPLEDANARFRILRYIRYINLDRWAQLPELPQVLREALIRETDPKLVTELAIVLRCLDGKLLGNLLAGKLREPSLANVPELVDEEEAAALFGAGAQIPGFLLKPPPLFRVKPDSPAARVVGFGDFGVGREAQREVARAIADFHAREAFDAGLTFGDNFYPAGMTSPEDPRWQDQWEKVYGPLRIPFYATLGNHDWVGSDSPAAQLLYARQSASWKMPALYYTYTVGPVQFFAVDTTVYTERQLAWLRDAIDRSRARWKIVYGHHPISVAANTNRSAYVEAARAKLFPVLRHRVDAYFCGHHHSLGHMRPEDGVHFYVVGGGGAGLYGVAPELPEAIFATSAFGFAVIEADLSSLRVRFVDSSGRVLHEDRLTK